MGAVVQKETGTQAKRALVASLCFVLFFGAGCGTVRSLLPRSVASGVTSSVSVPGVSLKSSGGVASPGKVSENVTESTFTLPAGSVLEFGALPGKPADAPATGTATYSAVPVSRVTLSAPVPFSFVSTTHAAETPKNFTPPTPAEIATADAGARALRWFFIAGVVLGAVAGFCFYTGHALAGLKFAAAAVAVPALAYFVASHVALIAGALLVGAAVAAVALWYSHVKPAVELADKLRGALSRDAR